MIAAFFLWFGFVITTLAVNNIFGMRRHLLILIDGAHWLVAMLLMGAIIGAWALTAPCPGTALRAAAHRGHTRRKWGIARLVAPSKRRRIMG